MLPVSVFFSIALATHGALAHWTWPVFLINGEASKDWQYIRDIANNEPDPTYDSKIDPLYAADSFSNTNFTCGREAFRAAPSTRTALVSVGSELGFQFNGAHTGQGLFHPGPTQVYMAKVPAGKTITTFTGYEDEAKWFKVASFAQKSDTAWATFNQPEVRFKLPKTTPSGDYLVRIESIYPVQEFQYAQFFISCAQITVEGPGGGNPTDFIKFPGGYKETDPGIALSEEHVIWKNLSTYVAPGPKVWTG